MLDSSCSETPKTKKKTAQNRPVQRFWPDSIASGAAQPAASELTVSEGGHQAGRPRPAGAGEAVIQGQAAVLLRPPWGQCWSRCPSAVQVCPGEWGVRPDARGRPRLSPCQCRVCVCHAPAAWDFTLCVPSGFIQLCGLLARSLHGPASLVRVPLAGTSCPYSLLLVWSTGECVSGVLFPSQTGLLSSDLLPP